MAGAKTVYCDLLPVHHVQISQNTWLGLCSYSRYVIIIQGREKPRPFIEWAGKMVVFGGGKRNVNIS